MNETTPLVKQLIIINVLFFVGAFFVPQTTQFLALYYPANVAFHYWQPLTYMFLHGGLLHIFFNMFALHSFGSMLEHFWGSKKFLFFYLSCGVGAALFQWGVNFYYVNDAMQTLVDNGINSTDIYNLLQQGKYNTQWADLLTNTQFNHFISAYNGSAVGASGAIYGLLTAFAFMFPEAELSLLFVPVPIKAKFFVPILVALDLFSGVTGYSIFGGGVAHFAHVGGAVIGFIMMWYWKKNQFKSL